MKSGIVMLVATGALLAGSAPAGRAGAFFDFYGYSYLDGAPFQVGTSTTIPMRFDPTQPDPVFPLDLEGNKYTVLVEGLEIVDVQAAGPIRVVTYANGSIQIFEDPSKNSEWTPTPPNLEVPGSFVDGALILSGVFTDCVLIFNTQAMTGTVQGHVDLSGGERFGEIAQPDGWLFFGGTTTDPHGNIPSGYDMAWDPQLTAPEAVATRSISWGAIKSLYR